MDIFKKRDKNVEFPLYNVDGNRDKVIHLCYFNFKEGGSLISNNTDSTADIVLDVFNMLSSILMFSQNTYTNFMIFRIVEFAFKSRLDSGYPLVKWCIRNIMKLTR